MRLRNKCKVRGCANRAGYYGLCRLHRRRAWRLMRAQPVQFGRLSYNDREIVRHIRRSRKNKGY